MKAKEIIEKIGLMLSGFKPETIEINLEKLKLEDGITVIESEAFEAGKPVFIITEDESAIPVPVGTYKLEDGRTLEVVEEGVIDSVGEAVEEPAEEPVDAVEEVVDAVEEPAEEPVEEPVADVSREEFDALVAMVEELKASMALNKETITEKETEIAALKVELSNVPATTKIKLGQTKDKKINNTEVKPAENSLGRIFQTINKNK